MIENVRHIFNAFAESYHRSVDLHLPKNEAHVFVVEEALFSVYLDAWKRGEAIVPRFVVQPVMIGVGAESNKDYNDLPSRLKNFVRRMTRRFAPSLWL